jgi:hypothetical protein
LLVEAGATDVSDLLGGYQAWSTRVAAAPTDAARS